MPWLVIIQATLIVTTGTVVAAAAVACVHRWSWHLPPADPTAQFRWVQSAINRARQTR